MTNKAIENPAKLVPLKEQALRAIRNANQILITQTRAGSTRRRLMQAKLNLAFDQFKDGQYAKAAITARSAHL